MEDGDIWINTFFNSSKKDNFNSEDFLGLPEGQVYNQTENDIAESNNNVCDEYMNFREDMKENNEKRNCNSNGNTEDLKLGFDNLKLDEQDASPNSLKIVSNSTKSSIEDRPQHQNLENEISVGIIEEDGQMNREDSEEMEVDEMGNEDNFLYSKEGFEIPDENNVLYVRPNVIYYDESQANSIFTLTDRIFTNSLTSKSTQIFTITKERRRRGVLHDHNLSAISSFNESLRQPMRSVQRYDEAVKNIKSRAFRTPLKELKELEKKNPYKESIELLIFYMREFFVVDANKGNNLAKLEYDIYDLLKFTLETDLPAKIDKLKIKYVEESSKGNFAKSNKISPILKEISKDYSKITQNISLNNLYSVFSTKSYAILHKTYSKVIEEFRGSENAEDYWKKKAKKKNKKYMEQYDVILNNLKGYFCNGKIDYEFVGRKKKGMKFVGRKKKGMNFVGRKKKEMK